ncbi:MAG: single-stranded DNA-binding protein [Sphingobacteriaceae bacterium]|nr:MAG: single-stranded DNA-binding protein [Sphingobacteriaceae bacterium]
MYSNTGLNKVILVGYITREPRLHTYKDNSQQLVFTITTNEIIRSNNGEIEHTENHHIKIDTNHSALKHITLKKGDMVYVQGKLQTTAHIDEQHIKRYKTEVVANAIEFFKSSLPESLVQDIPQ